MEYVVNTAVALTVTSTGLATGLLTLPTTFVKDGVVQTPTPTFAEIGGGLYTVTFTPAATGNWTVFVGGQTYPVQIVSRTLQTALGDVLDECLGSWTWNKSTGLLTLLRRDGTTLGTYNVLDTVEAASRERLT